MAFLDTITGVIARRILLNYRIDPEVACQILPPTFTPQIYNGCAIGGVCLIRFQDLRPKFLPAFFGANSENAAYRFAVEWQQDGETRSGVYIPRRESNSLLNRALGGKVFPGIFSRSQFDSEETESSVHLKIKSLEDENEIEFRGHIEPMLPSSSVFPNLLEASDFFLKGSTGYSATHVEGHFHGIELESKTWQVEAMHIEVARATYFDNPDLFPPGSIELDCALIMRNIEHVWNSQPDLFASQETPSLCEVPA